MVNRKCTHKVSASADPQIYEDLSMAKMENKN